MECGVVGVMIPYGSDTERCPMVRRIQISLRTHYLRHCRRYRATPNGVTIIGKLAHALDGGPAAFCQAVNMNNI